MARSKANENKRSLNITQPKVFIPTGNVQISITSQSIEIKMDVFTLRLELDPLRSVPEASGCHTDPDAHRAQSQAPRE